MVAQIFLAPSGTFSGTIGRSQIRYQSGPQAAGRRNQSRNLARHQDANAQISRSDTGCLELVTTPLAMTPA